MFLSLKKITENLPPTHQRWEPREGGGIGWFIKLSAQTFQPLIVIYKSGNFGIIIEDNIINIRFLKRTFII